MFQEYLCPQSAAGSREVAVPALPFSFLPWPQGQHSSQQKAGRRAGHQPIAGVYPSAVRTVGAPPWKARFGSAGLSTEGLVEVGYSGQAGGSAS